MGENDTGLGAALRRLPVFSGVVGLVALLAVLPWLPIESDTPGSRAAAFYAGDPLPTRVVTVPPDFNLTLHLVLTEEEAVALRQAFPNRATDRIYIVPPEEELLFARFRNDLNDQRAQRHLPAAVIDDRRNLP
jgi:hypothetical protein